MNGYKTKRHLDETALYCFARCEQFCRDFAESSEIPTAVLVERVAELFSRQAVRTGLGTADSMPRMRRATSRNGEPVEPMEMVGGARNGRAQTLTPHWTQLPENRKTMMRNIMAMRKKNPQKIKVKTAYGSYERSQPRPYARTRKQMAAARANAVLARKAYMEKHRKQQKQKRAIARQEQA